MTQLPSTLRRRRRRRVTYLVATACGLVGTWLMHSHSLPASIARQSLRLGQQHGITIGYGHPSTFFTAPYKAAVPDSYWLHMEQARLEGVAIALPAIGQALAQYPPGFVAKLIRAVFICDELRMEGQSAYGTVGRRWVILAAPTKDGANAISSNGLYGFHHELSSFVLEHAPGTHARWAEFAPSGTDFVYGRALEGRSHAKPPPLSTGFLSAYGATNPENDFNVYAEEVFVNPQRVIQAARQEPLVQRKLDFFMRTYEAIDPRMREVFRGLEMTSSD
jgi:hypothetical protein